MLNGEKGYPVQKAMQILVALGESFGAEEMLKVTSTHMPGASIVATGEGGASFVEEMQAKGGNFQVYTTTNPTAIDSSQWGELGIDKEDVEIQIRLTLAYKKMGAITCSTCTPYLIGHIPRLREHIAWGESSAVAFANSILGAYTNREGGPSALAAALTGRVPAYGFHLKDNRYGKVLINVSIPIKGVNDYGTLGYFAGSIAKQDVPVFTGISTDVTLDELKALSAALASSGAVSLFHIVGVTPEAPTLKAAFREHKPEIELEFFSKEKQETEILLNKEKSTNIDWVVFGCPHASIREFRDIAKALNGKRVHKDIAFWICSSVPVKVMAEQMGYAQIIREAGGILVCDTCPVLTTTRAISKKLGYRTLTTNSAKLAHYSPGQFGLLTHYGSMDKVIEAAIKGVWR